MFKQISKLLKSSTVVAVLLVSGCGGGTPAARDGSIVINPADVAWVSAGVQNTDPCTSAITYTTLVITVFNANNIPVADAGLHITLQLGDATNGGVMSLYDDPAWIGGSSTPPTNQVGASYTTKTGGDGTKTLIVGMDVSCVYKGYLQVSSGALYGQAGLSVAPGS